MLKLFNYFYKTINFTIHYKEIKSLTIIWMQIEKNMVETPKLVYVIILFLSIFLCTNSSFSQMIAGFYCKTDKDCPKLGRANVRCRNDHCIMIWK